MSTNVNKALAQSLIITPPRAYGSAGPFGQVVVFAVSTTPVVVDLTQLTFGLEFDPGLSQNLSGRGAPARGPLGAVGSYLNIYADGCDLGVIVGATIGAVSGANAPNLATVGILNSDGTYQGFPGTCYRIPNTITNEEARWRLQISQDNFVGIVASANGICRLYVSSEPGLQS